jgi:NADH-quinone oxidoreductase subunit C
MLTLEEIKSRIEQNVTGARIEIIPNASVPAQGSLFLNNERAFAAAEYLRDGADLRFDYASNATGVDWPDRVEKIKTKVKKVVDGVEKEAEETTDKQIPGFLEAVYHLYSMELKHGPLVIRLRTTNRTDKVHVPSLTPVWRGAEFQEREIYDLYGIVFDGHPDLRRLLMWDGFTDYPMRKDYVEPDDYEYEPTPHDDVLEKSKAHHAREAQT